jgi:hypothetical protein
MHLPARLAPGVIEPEIMQQTVCNVKSQFRLEWMFSDFALSSRLVCVDHHFKAGPGVDIVGQIKADYIGFLQFVQELLIHFSYRIVANDSDADLGVFQAESTTDRPHEGL